MDEEEKGPVAIEISLNFANFAAASETFKYGFRDAKLDIYLFIFNSFFLFFIKFLYIKKKLKLICAAINFLKF